MGNTENIEKASENSLEKNFGKFHTADGEFI